MIYFFVLITWTIVFWTSPALSLSSFALCSSPDHCGDPLPDLLLHIRVCLALGSQTETWCGLAAEQWRRISSWLCWLHPCWCMPWCRGCFAACVRCYLLATCCLPSPLGPFLQRSSQVVAPSCREAGPRLFSIPEARLWLGLRRTLWDSYQPIFPDPSQNQSCLPAYWLLFAIWCHSQTVWECLLSHYLGC